VNTVSIWRFGTSDGAEVALRAVERLQTRRLVVIDDLAVVVWRSDARRPDAYQVGTETGTAALSGAFWGLLFGLLFLLPLADVDEGDAVLARLGFTDEFVAHVRTLITAGTSAMFLLADRAAVDRIREAFAGEPADLLIGGLGHEQEAALWRAFDADDRLHR
jgi:uncharacterized membrane protein